VQLERPLWPILRSAADLLTSPEVHAVKECGSDRCSWLFVDRSRTHRRRWCDMKSCGNRAKARRHYQKTRAQAVRSGTRPPPAGD
jgi:predicted RNA-binding Zn ribbon-like protein